MVNAVGARLATRAEEVAAVDDAVVRRREATLEVAAIAQSLEVRACMRAPHHPEKETQPRVSRAEGRRTRSLVPLSTPQFGT